MRCIAADRARALAGGLLAVALAALAAPSLAQSPAEIAEARRGYDEGLSLEAAGDWAGALAAFEKVGRIKMTPQVRFHVARSKEGLGRWSEALGGYRMAEYEATESGAAGDVIAEIARARESIERRMPKLIVERGDGTESASIALDGVVLGRASIGAPMPVDPGGHVVEVTLPDGRSFERQVQTAEGETEQVHLDLPEELRDRKPAVAAPAVAGAEPAPREGAPSTTARPTASSLPWILGGIGAAGALSSLVFLRLRSDAADELDAQCLGRICPDTLEGTQERGERYALLAGLSAGIAVAGAGAAAVLWVGGSGDGATQGRRPWRVHAAVGPGRVMGSVGAGF